MNMNSHVKPRYIIIGCNIDNPYREFNLKQMTKEEAVSMCEDHDKLSSQPPGGFR